MPIANCIITPNCQKRSDISINLIELWAKESKISSEHMTVNLVTSSEQQGNSYTIMVTLLLPSIWSIPDISSLQTGLANALALYFDVTIDEVFIATNIIDSGMVVESGKIIEW